MMVDERVRAVEFIRMIDGDTFVANADLWPMVNPRPLLRPHIRIRGWNADELSEAEGVYMRDQIALILSSASTITVRSHGMSFARVVCDVEVDGLAFTSLLRRQLGAFRRRQRQKRG